MNRKGDYTITPTRLRRTKGSEGAEYKLIRDQQSSRAKILSLHQFSVRYITISTLNTQLFKRHDLMFRLIHEFIHIQSFRNVGEWMQICNFSPWYSIDNKDIAILKLVKMLGWSYDISEPNTDIECPCQYMAQWKSTGMINDHVHIFMDFVWNLRSS